MDVSSSRHRRVLSSSGSPRAFSHNESSGPMRRKLAELTEYSGIVSMCLPISRTVGWALTTTWYAGSAMGRYRYASTSALLLGAIIVFQPVLSAAQGPRAGPGRDHRRGALRRTPVARAGGGQRTEHDGRGDRALAFARSDGPAESQLWQHKHQSFAEQPAATRRQLSRIYGLAAVGPVARTHGVSERRAHQ